MDTSSAPFRVLLSFLGAGNYNEITYVIDPQYLPADTDPAQNQARTPYSPVAAAHFFKPDLAIFFVTEKAEEKHGSSIEAAFQEINIPIRKVLIEDGANEAQIWSIFNSITEAVEALQQEVARPLSLVFDITYGFRSLPVLALAVVVYLRTILRSRAEAQTGGKPIENCEIERIVYGAFEAVLTVDSRPMIVLDSFLDIIDWANGTEQFLARGTLDALAGVMDRIPPAPAQEPAEGKPRKPLLAISRDLKGLTNALNLARLQEASSLADGIRRDSLPRARKRLQGLPQHKPVTRLLNDVENTLDQIAQPADSLFGHAGFVAQANMIQFCLDTQQYQQAATLARESLVSWAGWQIRAFQGDAFISYNIRRALETEVLDVILRKKLNKVREKDPIIHLQDPIAPGHPIDNDQLAQAWIGITNIRNDLNHAGHKHGALAAAKIPAQLIPACQGVMHLLRIPRDRH